MGKSNFISKAILVLVSILLSFVVYSQESLTITSGDVAIKQGDVITPTAEYRDSIGEIKLVNIKWNTEPGYLGKVDKNGTLTANHAGEGFLIAKYKDLRDTVILLVEGAQKGNEDDDEPENDTINFPKVKVVPESIKVAVGDSVELRAFYINELGEKADTFFTWSVSHVNLGEFPMDTVSMFYAKEIGMGTITATLGDLADTVKLSVFENKDRTNKENNGNSGKQIVIMPGDTIVNADAGFIQYSATYKTNGNKHQNAEIVWSISDEGIASIDKSTGLAILTGKTGLAIISATYSNFRASTELLVVDTLADAIVNTISISRVLPNGNELRAKTFIEGETYKIGGLPYPLNILNGGMLHFPFGCIEEDIMIYMFIPEDYAEMNDDSTEVLFDDDIITGVKFSVKPVGSDTIVEPYQFSIPVNLRLVYKRGLLDSLGISPDSLDVFFADNTGFVTDGTGNVAVDTVKNYIYAAIEHFSTIVVRQKSATTFVNELDFNKEEILSVFPNPFNTSTNILYKVTESAEISLSIYNLYGQQVKELVNEVKPTGTYSVVWNGKIENGSLAANGIYFCKIIADGKESKVQRIILNR